MTEPVDNLDPFTQGLFDDIAKLEGELRRQKTLNESVKRALESLPLDSLGMDPCEGYAYRDELIHNICCAINGAENALGSIGGADR